MFFSGIPLLNAAKESESDKYLLEESLDA